MKKVLFATTALIATAGIASADITLSGAANATLISDGVNGNDTYLQTSVELDVAFSGNTDNGLAFGATMDIDTGADAGDPEMFISGAFGRLNFGAIAHAADGIGLADVGENGIGVDDAIEALRNGATADVSYSYTIDGLTLTLSTDIGDSATKNVAGEGDFSMLVGYKMGDFGIEAAFSDENDTGDSSTGIELAYAMGDISLGAMYASKDYSAAATRDLSGYGVSIGYAVNDALSLTAVYASVEVGAAGTPDQDDYGIGFSYSLGGGASIVGGMGEVNNVDEWDLGLAMKF